MAVKALMTDETGLQIVEAIKEKARLEERVSDLEKNKVDKSSIAQTTGTAEDKAMSQKAVTEELEKKFDKSNVVQSTGDAEDKVMSQAAATAEFGKLSEEIDQLGDDISFYEKYTDVSYEDIELETYIGYIKRADLTVLSDPSWRYAILPKLQFGKYAITGFFVKGDLVTTIVFADKNGNKVGELDLTDTTYIDHYELDFPANAVIAYLSYDIYAQSHVVTVSRPYNRNIERIAAMESMVGVFVAPTNQEEISFTGAVVARATNKSVENMRYVVMTDADYISSIGVLGNGGWNVLKSGTVVELNPTVSNFFALETKALANVSVTGNLYIFDTTGNDELNAFLLNCGLGFLNTPYNGIIARELSDCKTAIRDMKRSKFYNKKVVAFGDSITAQRKWFSGVEDYFGVSPINLGVGGSTVAGSDGFSSDERIATIPADTDLLLIMGGMNDWLGCIPLGEKKVTNTDITTVYGAVNVMIQKIMERVPNAKIVCMGCTYAVAMNRTVFGNTVGIYNAQGFTSVEYGKAIAEMFALNGFDSFVIGEHCGWNHNNISTYVTNDGYYVHPNDDGGAKMAEVIIENVQ